LFIAGCYYSIVVRNDVRIYKLKIKPDLKIVQILLAIINTKQLS
jgi:hypothetical protein